MNVLILGGTGWIGHNLLNLLIVDKRFEKIELLSRRELDIRDMKVINHHVDFAKLKEIPIYNPIEVLFIAFGTSFKKAGSQHKRKNVIVEIPTNVMKLAKKIGVEKCVLITSTGTSKISPIFYSRMHAQLEKNARDIGFKQLVIIKPSLIEGPSMDKSAGEKLSIFVGNAIGKTGLIDKFKPVEPIEIAKCMIQSIFDLPNGVHEITSEEIFTYAKKYTDYEFKDEKNPD